MAGAGARFRIASKIVAELFTAERQHSRCHLIQNCAKGKQIAARVQILALGLFGRHVGNRSYRHPRTGQLLFVDRERHDVHRRARRTAYRRNFRQPEVQYLGVAPFRNKNIGGLDVPVNDSLHVGRVERIGNLDSQREDRFEFHGTAGDPVFQRRAVQKLHRNVGLLAALADVVNGADIGMVQRRGCAGLTPETFHCLRVAGNVIWQELERDETAEFGVLSLVNHTHPAAAELFHDAVARDGLADHWMGQMLRGLSRQVNES
jgi:hypothetical protein